MAKELEEIIETIIDCCEESAFPIRICGRRTNCCGSFMKSLFHETKQMGIVLRKSFKGKQIWIPKIENQIKSQQE